MKTEIFAPASPKLPCGMRRGFLFFNKTRRTWSFGAVLFCALAVCFGFGFARPSLASPTASTEKAALAALQSGGHVLLMRHAQTVPGIGDPPHFKLDDCSTQRNLSEVGKDSARALGARLRNAGVKFDAVRTSAWCRCVDTAKLVFSPSAPKVFLSLNSIFNDRSEQPNRSEDVRDLVRKFSGKGNLALVTHMVNIQALTQESVSMNEALVLKPTPHTDTGFTLVGRLAP